jgi:hypothetical protein
MYAFTQQYNTYHIFHSKLVAKRNYNATQISREGMMGYIGCHPNLPYQYQYERGGHTRHSVHRDHFLIYCAFPSALFCQ